MRRPLPAWKSGARLYEGRRPFGRCWRQAGEEVMEMLFPIVVFTTSEGRNRLAELDAEELATLKRSIPSAVRKLHAYWMERVR